jgi:hypothetical protein
MRTILDRYNWFVDQGVSKPQAANLCLVVSQEYVGDRLHDITIELNKMNNGYLAIQLGGVGGVSEAINYVAQAIADK